MNTDEQEIGRIRELAGTSKKDAFYLALQLIGAINVETVSHDDTQANRFAEIAYAGLVYGNGALREEINYAQAVNIQRDMTALSLRALPIGETKEKAEEQARYWRSSFEGKAILPITLQELYFLLESSSRFGDTLQLEFFRTALFQQIIAYYEGHPEDIWGDTFILKTDAIPYTEKEMMIQRMEAIRTEQNIAIPPAESERVSYVRNRSRQKNFLRTVQRGIIAKIVHVQSLLKGKKNHNDIVFVSLYQKSHALFLIHTS